LANPDLAEFWDNSQQLYGEDIVFHRFGLLSGLFPNAYNNYIMASLPQKYFDKVAVFTLYPPTFEDTYEGARLEGGKDVRYWSFCVGDWATSGTTDCIIDDEVVQNADGSATICIAPFFLKRTVEDAGLNYLRWGMLAKPLLIHRHMMADESFEGSIARVPEIGHPPAGAEKEYYDENMAVTFMGDYGPSGKIYTVSEFRDWLDNR
jgi:hypothetical protein